MADVVAAPAAPAVTSPLSSPSPAPAASPTLVEQALAGASTAPPSSPAGTTNQTAPNSPAEPEPPQIAERPDDIPESLWDTEKGVLKLDTVKELAARVAADDARKAALPATADAYKAELPADFKAPDGVEFKVDESDPLLPLAKAQAHAMGATQEEFSRMLGVYAQSKAAELALVNSARAAEQAKLGTTAPARIDAVIRWMTAVDSSADKGDAQALAGMLVTARHVEAFERIIGKITSQGVPDFSQKHRESAVDTGIEGYEKMTFEQRRAAQDAQLANRRK